MLAYVFWHWKRPEVSAIDYEDRQRGFHAALSAAPSPGFIDSFSIGISNAPWTAGTDAYEDWYLVQDFASLGVLNDAAVSSSRAQPHDVAAVVAAGGTAGVYGLKLGTALLRPHYCHWFSKPDGMPYRDLFDQLASVVERAEGALWMRQMTLGPAKEFCLHAGVRVSELANMGPLVIPAQQIWPERTSSSAS